MADEIAYSALILDDDPVVLKSLQRALRKNGFITWTTSDQMDAIRFVQSHRPSIACIDLHMPEINGIEVINKMREIIPDIRFIVVTGYLDEYLKQIEPLKVRVVEKGTRTDQELEIAICKELELSRQEFEALKTREKPKLKARILFVDDEEDIADFTRYIATEEGLEAESARSIDEALIKAKTFKPDILCSDLHMSRGDGDVLIKKLISTGECPSIKVYIGMTGSEDENNRLLSAGAREVLNKPFDLTAIISSMRRWVEWANG